MGRATLAARRGQGHRGGQRTPDIEDREIAAIRRYHESGARQTLFPHRSIILLLPNKGPRDKVAASHATPLREPARPDRSEKPDCSKKEESCLTRHGGEVCPGFF